MRRFVTQILESYGYRLTEEDKRELVKWGVYLASFGMVIIGLVVWGLLVELFGMFTGADQYSMFDCARDFFQINDIFFYDTWKVFDLIERLFDLLRGSVIS